MNYKNTVQHTQRRAPGDVGSFADDGGDEEEEITVSFLDTFVKRVSDRVWVSELLSDWTFVPYLFRLLFRKFNSVYNEHGRIEEFVSENFASATRYVAGFEKGALNIDPFEFDFVVFTNMVLVYHDNFNLISCGNFYLESEIYDGIKGDGVEGDGIGGSKRDGGGENGVVSGEVLTHEMLAENVSIIHPALYVKFITDLLDYTSASDLIPLYFGRYFIYSGGGK